MTIQSNILVYYPWKRQREQVGQHSPGVGGAGCEQLMAGQVSGSQVTLPDLHPHRVQGKEVGVTESPSLICFSS